MARFRFRKVQRLRQPPEFKNVQDGPSTAKAGSRHFTVLVSARTPAPAAAGKGARLGVIASRRVGSAVRRNRAKRLVREYFRKTADTLGNIDVVVVVKTGANELTQREANDELAAALASASVRVRATRGNKP